MCFLKKNGSQNTLRSSSKSMVVVLAKIMYVHEQ